MTVWSAARGILIRMKMFFFAFFASPWEIVPKWRETGLAWNQSWSRQSPTDSSSTHGGLHDSPLLTVRGVILIYASFHSYLGTRSQTPSSSPSTSGFWSNRPPPSPRQDQSGSINYKWCPRSDMFMIITGDNCWNVFPKPGQPCLKIYSFQIKKNLYWNRRRTHTQWREVY